MSCEKNKSGLGKFIAGAAIGAGLGILFAPKKGSETRKELKEKMDELVNKAKDIDMEEVKETFERKVDEIKRDILSLYEADFAKIDQTGRLSILFDAIPAQLNKNVARFQPGTVIGKEQSDKILELIAELKDSKTVLVSYNVNDPNAGMSSTKDLSRFKLFLSDTGLFVTLMFKDKDFTENDIYQKVLSDKLRVNLGYLYENAVAQCIASNGDELFYHTIMNEETRHNYEVDFLLARKNKIVPIEVKSSGYKTHRSLDVFTEKYSGRILNRYIVYTKDMCKKQDILCVPVYMAMFI